MTIEIIGVIALVLGIIGLITPPRFLVEVFLFSTLLGSAAATVLEAVGGTNISPGHLLLGFLAARLLSDRRILNGAVQGVSFGQPGFWLLLTVLYSLISAYFMPRLFAGGTFTFAVRSQTPFSALLEPAMSNVTQSIYFVADFVCFFVIYGYAGSTSSRRALGSGVLACAALNLGFAALDLITYFTKTTELLSFIRNANYTLLSDTELAGFKRVVGSFVEASSFGAVTLGYFAFTLRLWLLGMRTRYTLALSLLSFVALLFSTSTTAYVGFAVFLLFCYCQIIVSAIRGSMTPRMALFISVTPVILLVAVVAIGQNNDLSGRVQYLFETTVLNKLSTDSGVERSSWNDQAMRNFFDTYGFGVGNGSLRASSFPIFVLASLGVIGTVPFALFFVTVLFSSTGERLDPINAAYRQAAKSACVALLITAATSGALIDLGLLFYALAALACARARHQPVRLRTPALTAQSTLPL